MCVCHGIRGGSRPLARRRASDRPPNLSISGGMHDLRGHKDPTPLTAYCASLGRICLLPCEELADLEQAITAYRARPTRAAKP
jgi:hypothetical protein